MLVLQCMKDSRGAGGNGNGRMCMASRGLCWRAVKFNLETGFNILMHICKQEILVGLCIFVNKEVTF